jgi:hypothetical protein
MTFIEAMKSSDAFKRPVHDNWFRKFPDGKIMEFKCGNWIRAEIETEHMLADDWKTIPIEIVFTWAAMCDLTALVEQIKGKLS